MLLQQLQQQKPPGVAATSTTAAATAAPVTGQVQSATSYAYVLCDASDSAAVYMTGNWYCKAGATPARACRQNNTPGRVNPRCQHKTDRCACPHAAQFRVEAQGRACRWRKSEQLPRLR